MKNVRRKVFNISEIHDSMVKEIAEKTGAISASEVFRMAIASLHQKLFPTYLAKKNAKADSLVTQTAIAAELGGEIFEKDGVKHCRYFTYIHSKRYEQELPLAQLDASLIAGQYEPSKEKVEAIRKAGKAEY